MFNCTSLVIAVFFALCFTAHFWNYSALIFVVCYTVTKISFILITSRMSSYFFFFYNCTLFHIFDQFGPPNKPELYILFIHAMTNLIY